MFIYLSSSLTICPVEGSDEPVAPPSLHSAGVTFNWMPVHHVHFNGLARV